MKQVNYNLAVYICEDLKCKYPVGYDCIVVERQLEKMHENLENAEDLDDWIDDVVALKEDDSKKKEESTDWIDNLVEEAVKDAKKQSEKVTNDCNFDEILNFLCDS